TDNRKEFVFGGIQILQLNVLICHPCMCSLKRNGSPSFSEIQEKDKADNDDAKPDYREQEILQLSLRPDLFLLATLLQFEVSDFNFFLIKCIAVFSFQ